VSLLFCFVIILYKQNKRQLRMHLFIRALHGGWVRVQRTL
jgi:hypothetical protein